MRLDAIGLRQAQTGDAEFIYRLVETTMRAYVEQIWGSFSAAYTRKVVAGSIASGIYSIVECAGDDIGALAVERHPTHIQLAQLYIAPSHQHRGIGTFLVRELMREAKESEKPLRLRVLSVNPARRLYEREGFRVTLVTPERVFMELGSSGTALAVPGHDSQARLRRKRLIMASAKQRAAARSNIKKAAKAGRKKRTISRLPKKTRTALGKQAAKVAKQKRRKKIGVRP